MGCVEHRRGREEFEQEHAEGAEKKHPKAESVAGLFSAGNQTGNCARRPGKGSNGVSSQAFGRDICGIKAT